MQDVKRIASNVLRDVILIWGFIDLLVGNAPVQRCSPSLLRRTPRGVGGAQGAFPADLGGAVRIEFRAQVPHRLLDLSPFLPRLGEGFATISLFIISAGTQRCILASPLPPAGAEANKATIMRGLMNTKWSEKHGAWQDGD